MITTNALWKSIEYTLEDIGTEDLSKEQVAIGKGKLCKATPMKKGLVRNMEVAGTTFLLQKPEGQAMATEEIILGGIAEFIPVTMAKEVSITEEALEDNEYDKILQPSTRLMTSAWKTEDVGVANVALNCLTTTGGYDKVALASASHLLPSGQTVSNCLASTAGGSIVGMTPSPQALQQMRAMAALMPGPNGLPDSLELRAITFPEVQLDLWKIITQTSQSVGNNFNDINTVKSYNLDLIPVKWYDAVSQQFWACLTNAEEGITYYQRKKPSSRTWVDNNGMVAHHGVSFRGIAGWSNWRHFLLGFSPA
jgi:hypothetical protein